MRLISLYLLSLLTRYLLSRFIEMMDSFFVPFELKTESGLNMLVLQIQWSTFMHEKTDMPVYEELYTQSGPDVELMKSPLNPMQLEILRFTVLSLLTNLILATTLGVERRKSPLTNW